MPEQCSADNCERFPVYAALLLIGNSGICKLKLVPRMLFYLLSVYNPVVIVSNPVVYNSSS